MLRVAILELAFLTRPWSGQGLTPVGTHAMVELYSEGERLPGGPGHAGWHSRGIISAGPRDSGILDLGGGEKPRMRQRAGAQTLYAGGPQRYQFGAE